MLFRPDDFRVWLSQFNSVCLRKLKRLPSGSSLGRGAKIIAIQYSDLRTRLVSRLFPVHFFRISIFYCLPLPSRIENGGPGDLPDALNLPRWRPRKSRGIALCKSGTLIPSYPRHAPDATAHKIRTSTRLPANLKVRLGSWTAAWNSGLGHTNACKNSTNPPNRHAGGRFTGYAGRFAQRPVHSVVPRYGEPGSSSGVHGWTL